MTVESANVFSDLNAAAPAGNEPVSEGDGHLVLIKGVLQTQFPGGPVGTGGLDEIITVTAQEFNALMGAKTTETIQEQIDNIEAGTSNELNAPIGTTLIFYQVDLPNGWVYSGVGVNTLLRCATVQSEGGSSGGTDDPKGFNFNHNHGGYANNKTITVDKVPTHYHELFNNNYSEAGDAVALAYVAFRGAEDVGDDNTRYRLQRSLGNQSANVGISSNNRPTADSGDWTGTHNHSINSANVKFEPRYINVIKGIRFDP